MREPGGPAGRWQAIYVMGGMVQSMGYSVFFPMVCCRLIIDC